MKIKMIAAAIATTIASAVLVSSPVMAAGGTCPTGTKKAGSAYTNSIAECNIEEDDSLMPSVRNIINVIIGVLGIAAVFVIVLGGVEFTTSQGDPGKVKKGKDTILYGVIGLVVAVLAFAIVNFVMQNFFHSPADPDPDADPDAAIVYQIG